MKTKLFLEMFLISALTLIVFITPASAIITKYTIYDLDGVKIKGWQPQDGTTTIQLKIWLDALTEDQKALVKLALNQWSNFATLSPELGTSNYAGSDPAKPNTDVMNGEVLQNGTSGRNLTSTDINGMKELYSGKTFELSYVDDKASSNFTVENADAAESAGGANMTSSGKIVSGWVKLPNTLPDAGGNPPIPSQWYYTTDSDSDGKITNKDKDKAGKRIDQYTTAQGDFLIYTHLDFYSQVKHEIGHALGFDHSSIVPEPITFLMFGFGIAFISLIKVRS